MGNFEEEFSKVQQKSELLGQDTSFEQKWMFDCLIFSFSSGNVTVELI